MKRRILSGVQILLNIELNHLIFVAAAVSILGLIGVSESYLLLWIFLSIVPVGMYCLRVKTKRISVFFAIILAILAEGIGVPMKIEVKVLLIGMLLMYALFAIRKKLTENPEMLELVSPAVFVVLTGAMTYKNHIHVSLCYGIAWVYLVIYFLYYFVTAYLQFVGINENSASNIPEKELFSHGIKNVGNFVVIALMILLLTSHIDWVAHIVEAIGAWVRNMLKELLAYIEEPIIEESTVKQPVMDSLQGEMFPAAEQSEWMQLLHRVLEVLYNVITFVVLIVVAVCSVRGIIRYVKENFTKERKRKEAKSILSNQDIRESCRTEATRKKRKSILGFLSNEQRIRALYKKRVLHEKNRIVGEAGQKELAYWTAKECCDKIGEVKLQKIYEKARYSSEKITFEDIKSVKE